MWRRMHKQRRSRRRRQAPIAQACARLRPDPGKMSLHQDAPPEADKEAEDPSFPKTESELVDAIEVWMFCFVRTQSFTVEALLNFEHTYIVKGYRCRKRSTRRRASCARMLGLSASTRSAAQKLKP